MCLVKGAGVIRLGYRVFMDVATLWCFAVPGRGGGGCDSGSCVLVLGAKAVQVVCSEWDLDGCSNNSVKVCTIPSLLVISGAGP